MSYGPNVAKHLAMKTRTPMEALAVHETLAGRSPQVQREHELLVNDALNKAKARALEAVTSDRGFAKERFDAIQDGRETLAARASGLRDGLSRGDLDPKAARRELDAIKREHEKLTRLEEAVLSTERRADEIEADPVGSIEELYRKYPALLNKAPRFPF